MVELEATCPIGRPVANGVYNREHRWAAFPDRATGRDQFYCCWCRAILDENAAVTWRADVRRRAHEGDNRSVTLVRGVTIVRNTPNLAGEDARA